MTICVKFEVNVMKLDRGKCFCFFLLSVFLWGVLMESN